MKLLHAIQRVPGRRLPELAEEAGIHINTAREHLHVLETEGLISSRTLSTGARGRPPVVFDPVRLPEVNRNADRRAAQAQSTGDLMRRIDPSLDESEKLGIEALHQIDTLYSHLDDVGFRPEFDSEDLEFELKPCPFHELLDEHGAIVCAVHARLIQDQLEQVTGPLSIRELQPFVTPHQCRIALSHAEDPEAGERPPKAGHAGTTG